MTRQLFVLHHCHRWKRLAAVSERISSGIATDTELVEFPGLLRGVSRDLLWARQHGMDEHLVEFLNLCVLRGQMVLYAPRPWSSEKLLHFLRTEFPCAVRRDALAVGTLGIIFFGSILCLWAAVHTEPRLIFSVAPLEHVQQLEDMYAHSDVDMLRPRGRESDVAMFGYYISNNVDIGFRAFASGLFLGVGTLAMLILNGVYFGAVAGHLSSAGMGDVFFPFVITHSAPELWAILLSSVAGWKLGWALLSPGPYRRVDALRLAARDGVTLMYGAAGLLLLAATIEAFWSASPAAPEFKYFSGGAMWILLLTYFIFAGRRYAQGD